MPAVTQADLDIIAAFTAARGAKVTRSSPINAQTKLGDVVRSLAKAITVLGKLPGTVVVLPNASGTLTVTQMVDSRLLSIAPTTADRTLTTATAALLIAAIPGAAVGMAVDFSIIYSPVGAILTILAQGTGVTIVGSPNMGSAVGAMSGATRWRILVTSATTVSIIRVAG